MFIHFQQQNLGSVYIWPHKKVETKGGANEIKMHCKTCAAADLFKPFTLVQHNFDPLSSHPKANSAKKTCVIQIIIANVHMERVCIGCTLVRIILQFKSQHLK